MKLNIQLFAIFAYLVSMALGAILVDLSNETPVISFLMGGMIASFWTGAILTFTPNKKQIS